MYYIVITVFVYRYNYSEYDSILYGILCDMIWYNMDSLVNDSK